MLSAVEVSILETSLVLGAEGGCMKGGCMMRKGDESIVRWRSLATRLQKGGVELRNLIED